MNQRIRNLRDRFGSMPSLPRKMLGIGLLLGGVFWFLPILGLWMIPLGLLVLSKDFHWARRGYLSMQSWIRKWRDRRRASGIKSSAENRASSE